jgi:hypothetical protein
MALSKEEMRLYQRARRAKLKVAPVCASCELLRVEIGETVKRVVALEKENLSLRDELEDKPDIPKPKIVKQDWRKDKVVGCRKFGE